MTLTAMSPAVEERLAHRGIADHDRARIEGGLLGSPGRNAVQIGRDGGYGVQAEIKLGHTLVRAPRQRDRVDGLAFLIGEHQGRAQQIRTALPAATIRSMTKTAVDAEYLLTASNLRRVTRWTRSITRGSVRGPHLPSPQQTDSGESPRDDTNTPARAIRHWRSP